MKEIIIVIGNGRAGKTTYVHKIEKKEYEFINLDKNYRYVLNLDKTYHYGGEKPYFKFLDFLTDKLNDSDKNFVLDGYHHVDSNFVYLKKKLKHHKIKPIMIFANYGLIQKRSDAKKGEVRTRKQIIQDYNSYRNYWNIEEFEFVEGDGENRILENYEKGMEIVSGTTKQNVIDFLEKLKTRPNSHYQTIELPFDMKIRGFNDCLEHKSWDEISKIYNFKAKKVADIGCYNGFFCFEARKLGAEVVGYDKSESAIKTAKEIAELKSLDIKFEVFDLDKEEIPEEYDVILFLNASHHLKNPKIAFNKIFSKAKDVILEVHFTQTRSEWSIISKEELIEIAKKYNHKLIKEIRSHRPNRKIMLFRK